MKHKLMLGWVPDGETLAMRKLVQVRQYKKIRERQARQHQRIIGVPRACVAG